MNKLNRNKINKLYEVKYSEWYTWYGKNSNPSSYIWIHKDKKDLTKLRKFIKDYPESIEKIYIKINNKEKITKKAKETIIKYLNKWFYWKTIIDKIKNKEF